MRRFIIDSLQSAGSDRFVGSGPEVIENEDEAVIRVKTLTKEGQRTVVRWSGDSQDDDVDLYRRFEAAGAVDIIREP